MVKLTAILQIRIIYGHLKIFQLFCLSVAKITVGEISYHSMLWERFWDRKQPRTVWCMTAFFVSQNSSKVQSRPHFRPRETWPCHKSVTMLEIMDVLLESQRPVQRNVDHRIIKIGICVKPSCHIPFTHAFFCISLRFGSTVKVT